MTHLFYIMNSMAADTLSILVYHQEGVYLHRKTDMSGSTVVKSQDLLAQWMLLCIAI